MCMYIPVAVDHGSVGARRPVIKQRRVKALDLHHDDTESDSGE